MLVAVSPSIERYLIGKSTVRTWVKEEFNRTELDVQKVLAEAKSRIHISFDL